MYIFESPRRCYMTNGQIENIDRRKQSRHKRLRVFLYICGFLLIIVYLALFFGFNYFGERFLRNLLQEKVSKESSGLYRVDFQKLNFNIITGKVIVDSFELIPDTLVYNRLKANGLIEKSLYRISLSSVEIDRIHFWQIYSQKRINFRQVVFTRPVIGIVGFPDTITAKKARWRVIYEDLYPAVSDIFNDFHVDSVKVNHGMLLTVFRQKTGKLSTGEYEYSATLRDVSVNPFSYYNRERVFYARDIDWMVHGFEVILADSLYFLKADEIGFSLKKSRLFASNLSLQPNFKQRALHKRTAGDFFSFTLPSLWIEGVDLYHALIDKEVVVKTLDLTGLQLKIYHNLLEHQVQNRAPKKARFKIANLYTIVEGVLRNLSIDTLKINRASFEYFAHLNDQRPEIQVGTVDLKLGAFFLDSIAHLDKNRIFYSEELESTLGGLTVEVRDKVHTLNAGKVYLSTKKSYLTVKEIFVTPNQINQKQKNKREKNTISLLVPNIAFHGLNMIKLFNYSVFKFNLLEIDEPNLVLTRHQMEDPPQRRFNVPSDFFEEKNEDFLFDIMKRYLSVIEGKTIDLENGHVEVVHRVDGKIQPIASAHLNLQMMNFLIDSAHGMNRQGYFYSRDFNLTFSSVSARSPDGLLHLNIRKGSILTMDSLIIAEGILFERMVKPLSKTGFHLGQRVIDMHFSLGNLTVTGLNHRKLFLEQVLKANTIILGFPSLSMKSELKSPPSDVVTQPTFIHPKKAIRDFEIGSMIVQHGSFTFHGEKDNKTTYFSLKDIDFKMLHSKIHIPEEQKRDGIIRFDSLTLSILPFKATIADSTYLLECQKLTFHSYPSIIKINGLTINPVDYTANNSKSSSQFTISIPELNINGFYFDKAIFNNEWFMDQVYFDKPVVHVDLFSTGNQVKESNYLTRNYTFTPPPFIKTLYVQKIDFVEASLEILKYNDKRVESTTLKDFSLHVSHVKIDSTTNKSHTSHPLFNAENITCSIPALKHTLKDSIYTLSVHQIGFSTGGKSAYIDSLQLKPNYSRSELPGILGHQTDIVEVTIPQMVFSEIDFRQLLDSGHLIAKRVNIRNLQFADYRDKRVTLPHGPTPFMPQQMLKKITLPMRIDSIFLSDAYVSYEEQINSEPGRIFFSNTNMLLTGFSTMEKMKPTSSNIPPLIVHGNALLMGAAPVEAWAWFPLNHPRDSFNLKANVGLLNLPDLNPIVSHLLPVSINSGVTEKTHIQYMHANKENSRGFMDVTFSGFSVRLENTGSGAADPLKTLLMNEIVNIIIPDQNPRYDGKYRTGVIYYQRDTLKSFFNFVWKSTLSGLKSSVGFNDKMQRKIRKAARKEK